MDDLIARLEGLSAKATKGPWAIRYCYHETNPSKGIPRNIMSSKGKIITTFNSANPFKGDEKRAHADLIVALVNNLPEILNALRARAGHIEAQGGEA